MLRSMVEVTLQSKLGREEGSIYFQRQATERTGGGRLIPEMETSHLTQSRFCPLGIEVETDNQLPF
jgi:hypothetical protein